MDRTQSFVSTLFEVCSANEPSTRAIIETMRVHGYIQDPEYSRMNTFLNQIAPHVSLRLDGKETIEEARLSGGHEVIVEEGQITNPWQQGGHSSIPFEAPTVTFRNEWPTDWERNESSVHVSPAVEISDKGVEFIDPEEILPSQP